MRNFITLLSILGLLFMTTVTEADKLYKWKDKDGTIKYSQQPPPEGEYQVIKKSNKSSLGKEVAAPVIPDEDEEQATPEELFLKSKKQNCDAAKLNHSILTGSQKVRSTDGKLLSDDERNKQIALAKKQISIYCDKEEN